MSALAEQHASWTDARRRLWGGVTAPPEIERFKPRPTSPFGTGRKRRLFTRAIEEVDDYGNVVISGLYMPEWKRIALECAAKHEVSFSDLVSARRDRAVVRARHEAFWRCKQETSMSLPQIGSRFGKRDHTTVIHGVRKHALRMGEANAN